MLRPGVESILYPCQMGEDIFYLARLICLAQVMRFV